MVTTTLLLSPLGRAAGAAAKSATNGWRGEGMGLSLAFGVVMALVWVIGAVLIGIRPSGWGGGIALSMISGMALGGIMSVILRYIRARAKPRSK
jgi:hypothetical protein